MNQPAAVNKAGQSLGQKGRRTRQKIIAAAKHLLGETQLGDLTVLAVAQRAGISKAALYLYFDDVGDILLSVLDEVSQDVSDVLARLAEPWSAKNAYRNAYGFVEAYFELWFKHGPALRLRNHLADQGDSRFVDLRYRSGIDMTTPLALKFQEIWRDDLNEAIAPISFAAVIITALERLATVAAFETYGVASLDWKSGGKALAHMIVRTMYSK